MNIAYVRFYTFGKQDSGDEDSSQKKKATAAVRHTPADPQGYAREPDSVIPDLYGYQIAEETRLIVLWMRRLCADLGIVRAAIPPMTSEAVTEKIAKLYYCGENIDTITSRKRFTSHMDNDDKNVQAMSAVNGGPLIWYLDRLIDEHTGKEPCTAVARDAVHNANDLADAALLLNTRMNDLHGTTNLITDAAAKDLAKALGDGWYLDEILRPEILSQRESLEALAAALASGAIPMPEHEGDMRHSYIGKLLADRRNACPKDAEGFHVDELTWTLLLRNLHRRKPTMLTGPTGAGKTQVVQLLCERTGTPLTVIPMGTVTDPTEQLVGKMDLDPATGGTRFDWADFALAIQRPGVILLDEINRCPRNGNNILFSVLDGTATLSAAGAKSSDQRSIRVHPDCVFFATANIGYEYTGTSEIDIALRNRFMEVELDYLDAATEAKVLCARTGVDYDDARNIAQIATGIRKSHCNGTLQKSVSMRVTLNCARRPGLRGGVPARLRQGHRRTGRGQRARQGARPHRLPIQRLTRRKTYRHYHAENQHAPRPDGDAAGRADVRLAVEPAVRRERQLHPPGRRRHTTRRAGRHDGIPHQQPRVAVPPRTHEALTLRRGGGHERHRVRTRIRTGRRRGLLAYGRRQRPPDRPPRHRLL